jgi:nicotinic acetylcholine receptor, invertebrate
MYLKFLFLLFNLFSLGKTDYSYKKRVELRNEIFEEYCHDSLPTNLNETMNISLGIALRAFKNVDQIEGTVSANIWLRYSWTDERLAWETNKYNLSFISLSTHPELDRKIWTPDIYLYNTAENPLAELDFSRAIVSSNGDVLWSRPGIITSTCSFDLTNFPYDKQVCYLKFGSWSYDGNQLDLSVQNSSFDISNFIEHEEWKLIHYNGTKNVQYYNCCPEPYYDIKFFYSIQRNSGYYDLNIILPTFATSTLILMTLFVPWSSGERISFAVTVMLSIVVFLLILSDNLPKSDQKPLLSRMIIGLTLFSLVGVFFTIIISALTDYNENFSSDDKKKISNIFIKFLYDNLAKISYCKNTDELEEQPEIESQQVQNQVQRQNQTQQPQLGQIDYRTNSYYNSVSCNSTSLRNRVTTTELQKKKDKKQKEECEKMINYFETIYIVIFSASFIIYCIVMFNFVPSY